MSKNSELSQVLEELKTCGNSLIAIANSLTKILYSESTEVTNTPTAQPEEPAEELTFLDVRKVFADISRAGHTDALKELIKKYGAEKLSSVDPSQYAALLKDAKAIQ